ncbi:MFS-type transporter SLC18B1-like isoform X3 [Varroa jacobsoni]|uniref:MFS-type transporter SLC18B1-like isoform X3 n=1 Tax=Varroa jacobsoni TaxID=62625 RepID=UPI000BF80051|nr:MFS-type transporter SLC18B1-like isoform X3 [Varroa jacobsoni]
MENAPPRRSPLDSTSGFSTMSGLSRASAVSAISTPSRLPDPVSGFLSSIQQAAKWLWRKKWLVPVLHSQFWFSACFSLLAPFYPTLADLKGVHQSVYGYVFSVFKLFMFIGSITSEKLIEKFSPVPLYVVGLLGTFLFDICIGSLFWVNDRNIFIGLSFPLAVVGGFLACSYSISMYSILTERFSTKPGLIIASMEFLWGIGNMVGTLAGGVLIDFWNFSLPFFASGIIMVMLIPTIIKNGPIKPSRSHSEKDLAPRSSFNSLNQQDRNPELSACTNTVNGSQVDYRRMVFRPLFLIDMVTVCLSWVVMSFNEPTLARYLTQQEEFFLFFGQLCTALAFLVIGPAPFIQSEPKLSFIYLSQVFTGLGMAGQFVCGFAHALKISIKAGYPGNIKTSGVIASATFIFMVLGAIVTPPIASYLVERFQYRTGSMFIFILLLFWSVVNLGVFIKSLIDKIRSTN